MLSEIFDQIKEQWLRAKHQKKHPFRYFVLSTSSQDHTPQSRMVVLRDFDSHNMVFTIFTDVRSKKMTSLRTNDKACLLFYDPKRLWQIQVQAQLIKQSTDPKQYTQLPKPAQKDYTTRIAPGSPIDNPSSVDYLEAENYFTSLEFEVHSIESLKLKSPHHVRSLFERETHWEGTFLVP